MSLKIGVIICSLVPAQTFPLTRNHSHTIIFLPFQNWEGLVDLVMSHGCGLNIHGRGLNFLDTHRLLPMLFLPGIYLRWSISIF